jgi:hypothetical protein
MTNPDLRRADRRRDPQASERNRDRIPVLTDRDQRLAVDPDRRHLRAVKRRGQRPQHRPLNAELLSDGDRPSRDPPAQIALACIDEQPVELPERPDARDRDQVVASQPADLTLHAALHIRRQLRLIRLLRSELFV